MQGPVLEGTLVRLEPLEHGHAADLAEAAEPVRRPEARAGPVRTAVSG